MEKGVFSIEKKNEEWIIVKRERNEEDDAIEYVPVLTGLQEEEIVVKVCHALNDAYREGLSDAFGSF